MNNVFLCVLVCLIIISGCTEQNKSVKKVLIFTRNGEGYVHDNIPSSVEAIEKLGEEHHFQVDVSDTPSVFTDENLAQYDALIFSNTNNEVFETDAQKIALIRYTESGGGVVGIHSACATERDWPWMWNLIGGKFVRHAPFQEFSMKVIDPDHPSTGFFKADWTRADECYYVNHINPDIHVLIAADMTTVEDGGKEEYPGKTFGDLFPLVWCHEFDGGRQWFTALGHSKEDYSMPLFRQHLLGGIQWAMENGKPDYTKATSTTLK
jgi:type 1 glutamine amidotransferase